MTRLLKVTDLETQFSTDDGVVSAVDGVSLSVDRGETLGIVGESGSGKSVALLSVMRLIPCPPGRIAGGEILFEGKDLLKMSQAQMRHIRGNEIAMIFQEPMTSLNPVFTIGYQLIEAVMLHQNVGTKEARGRAIDMLRVVGIPSPERRIDDYPYQLSGGMRQRAMIAMALSCNPKLLIADEPTTALDVTIQAQILELIMRLKDELGTSVILITHDLGVIAETADNVAVMYAGRIVERGDVMSMFMNPLHPYTEGLLGSIPKLNETRDRLQLINGSVPNPFRMPSGCRFHPRCGAKMDICSERQPSQVTMENGHAVSCWRYL